MRPDPSLSEDPSALRPDPGCEPEPLPCSLIPAVSGEPVPAERLCPDLQLTEAHCPAALQPCVPGPVHGCFASAFPKVPRLGRECSFGNAGWVCPHPPASPGGIAERAACLRVGSHRWEVVGASPGRKLAEQDRSQAPWDTSSVLTSQDKGHPAQEEAGPSRRTAGSGVTRTSPPPEPVRSRWVGRHVSTGQRS